MKVNIMNCNSSSHNRKKSFPANINNFDNNVLSLANRRVSSPDGKHLMYSYSQQTPSYPRLQNLLHPNPRTSETFDRRFMHYTNQASADRSVIADRMKAFNFYKHSVPFEHPGAGGMEDYRNVISPFHTTKKCALPKKQPAQINRNINIGFAKAKTAGGENFMKKTNSVYKLSSGENAEGKKVQLKVLRNGTMDNKIPSTCSIKNVRKGSCYAENTKDSRIKGYIKIAFGSTLLNTNNARPVKPVIKLKASEKENEAVQSTKDDSQPVVM